MCQRPDRLRSTLFQMRDDGQEHLRGREGITQSVVLTMHRKSQVAGQLSERQESRRRFSSLGHEQAAERVGVEDRATQPEPLGGAGPRSGKARSTLPGGQRGLALPSPRAGARSLRQAAALASRSTVRMPWTTTEASGRTRVGRAEAVKASSRSGESGVDWHGAKGDDLVAPRIESAELEIDDTKAGRAPRSAASRQAGTRISARGRQLRVRAWGSKSRTRHRARDRRRCSAARRPRRGKPPSSNCG